jgi:hypothetical protein
VENFSLSGVKGRQTVNPNIPGAEVRLNGVEYPGGVKELSIPAETYEVRVSKPGFRTFTKTITLSPRGSVTVDAPLEIVPVEQLLAQAASYLQSSRYPQAIASSREILAGHPDNAPATVLLGLAYYYSEEYSESATTLTRAIALGQQFILPIRHIHKGIFNEELCSGRLTIGKGMLGFTSTDKTGHDFNVPANKIYELTFEPRKQGRVHVQVGIPKGSKEEKKTYNFHVSHAATRRFDPNNETSIIVVYCINCDAETDVIYQLLRQLKDAPAPSSTQPQLESESTAGRPTLKPRPAELDSNDRPTMTRLPPSPGSALGAGTAPGSKPELAFAGRENYQTGGRNWTRYKLTVMNHTAYSDDMFTAAPDLPPCGLNTKSSRTWVDIFDQAGKRLYGFCAFSSSAGLVSLWFALPEGQSPPAEVFIVLNDRLSKRQYKSNLAAIP